MADDILKTIELYSKGYGLIPKLVMQDRSLHVTSKAIYAYVCSYAGSGDACFPSRTRICADLGISIDTCGKYLKQLTDKGYIECSQIKGNRAKIRQKYVENEEDYNEVYD